MNAAASLLPTATGWTPVSSTEHPLSLGIEVNLTAFYGRTMHPQGQILWLVTDTRKNSLQGQPCQEKHPG
jgi:hypothetical protein